MPLAEAGTRSNGKSGPGASAFRTRGHAPNAAVVANAPSNCRRVINGVSSFFERLKKVRAQALLRGSFRWRGVLRQSSMYGKFLVGFFFLAGSTQRHR